MKLPIKNKAAARLNRIAGQVAGLGRMIERDTYCVDIIHQSTAIKKALSSFEDLMLEHHLSTHVVHQMKHNKTSLAISEVMKVYKLSKDK